MKHIVWSKSKGSPILIYTRLEVFTGENALAYCDAGSTKKEKRFDKIDTFSHWS
jgi:hypothetical protein